MYSKYKPVESHIPHFVTFTIIGWIDVFTREDYKEILLSSLKYCIDNKGLKLHAWVIMTNHVHLIISTKGAAVSAMVRDIKKYTSKKIIAAINNNTRESRKSWMMNMFEYAGKTNNDNKYYQLWKQYYHPIVLNNHLRQQRALHYLHYNPVKAGLAWEPWHYKYSSGIDYYTNEEGLLKIDRLF